MRDKDKDMVRTMWLDPMVAESNKKWGTKESRAEANKGTQYLTTRRTNRGRDQILPGTSSSRETISSCSDPGTSRIGDRMLTGRESITITRTHNPTDSETLPNWLVTGNTYQRARHPRGSRKEVSEGSPLRAHRVATAGLATGDRIKVASLRGDSRIDPSDHLRAAWGLSKTGD